MNPSDDLFLLIRSMDKSEKRYCRLAMARGVGKEAGNCIALFDAVAAMRVYDERALRAKLAGSPALKHLAVTKHHLYAMLLRHLRAYHVEEDAANTVRDLLESATMLIERGLLDQARKLADRARAIAGKYQLLTLQIEIADTDLWIAYHGTTPELNTTQHVFQEVGRLHRRSADYWELFRLSKELTAMLLHSGKPRNTGERGRYDAIMNHPLLQDISPTESFAARHMFHDCHRIYYLAIRDYENGRLNSIEHIALLESEEGRRLAEPVNYPIILHAHLTICIALGRRAEAEEAYRKLAAIPKMKGVRGIKLQQVEYNCLLALAMSAGDLESLIGYAPEIETFVREHADLLSAQIPIAFNFAIALAYFLRGKYPPALRLLQPIINEPHAIREDYQGLARLLRMMIHFEIGDHDLIPYLWRSTYRYFRKRNSLHRFEKSVLDFLRRLIDAATDRDRRRMFAEAREKIIELRNDPDEQEMTLWFNIVSWLDKRVAN